MPQVWEGFWASESTDHSHEAPRFPVQLHPVWEGLHQPLGVLSTPESPQEGPQIHLLPVQQGIPVQLFPQTAPTAARRAQQHVHHLREGFKQKWLRETHADAQRGEELSLHRLWEVIFVLGRAVASHSVPYRRGATYLHPLWQRLLHQRASYSAHALPHRWAAIQVLKVPEAIPHFGLRQEAHAQPQWRETFQVSKLWQGILPAGEYEKTSSNSW